MPKLVFVYINICGGASSEHWIVFTPKPKGTHWRRLINHLNFDMFANSAFVFNTISPKRYKFKAFYLQSAHFTHVLMAL